MSSRTECLFKLTTYILSALSILLPAFEKKIITTRFNNEYVYAQYSYKNPNLRWI